MPIFRTPAGHIATALARCDVDLGATLGSLRRVIGTPGSGGCPPGSTAARPDLSFEGGSKPGAAEA